MEPFRQHTGLIAVLPRANVDTDQIIPKQFLKSIRRTGFSPALFFDWRYLPDGSPNPEFELNQPRFAGASILVTGNNFGCGSSREHAVWALQQYGFKVLIAPWMSTPSGRVAGFADIFRSNAIRNGLLLIELSEPEVRRIQDAVSAHEGLRATVDLETQKIVLHIDPPQVIPFECDPQVRQTLLEGLDEIRQTLQWEAEITAFEQRHDVQLPAQR
jgi:3-isopropylmalate/(R)-2-methylmalate dehydratase small subunit